MCTYESGYNNFKKMTLIKAHGSVLCSPSKRSVRTQREYIDTKNKIQFSSHWYEALCDLLSEQDQNLCSGFSILEEAMYVLDLK